ncbi:MAG: hypothetical protein GY953_46550, partial [bacterium]|nr:hypothetical protein [bacterium]
LLLELRETTIWTRINHPELKTIYPPAAQLLARVSYLAHSTTGIDPLLAWKLLILLVEMSGAAVLAFALYAKKRGPAFLIYAWSPLAVVEFYGSGHVDGAGVGIGAAALGCILMHRRILSGAFFVTAFLTKLIVAPVGIAFFALRGRLRRAAGALVVGVLLCAPFAGAGRSALESLNLYQAEWEFNGVIHRILKVDSWGALPSRISEGRWDILFDAGSIEQKRIGRFVLTGLVLAGG